MGWQSPLHTDQSVAAAVSIGLVTGDAAIEFDADGVGGDAAAIVERADKAAGALIAQAGDDFVAGEVVGEAASDTFSDECGEEADADGPNCAHHPGFVAWRRRGRTGRPFVRRTAVNAPVDGDG